MRMFRITINGRPQPHEPAGGRSPELLQHSIVERMKESGIQHPFVRVQEYVTRGAAAPARKLADEDDE